MDRTQIIARHVRTVRGFKDGKDITASLGVDTVKYEADGTAWRKLADGSVEHGTWRFINREQTQLEVTTPKGGTTRWLVIELHDDAFRKANIDNAIELIYAPVT